MGVKDWVYVPNLSTCCFHGLLNAGGRKGGTGGGGGGCNMDEVLLRSLT